MKEKTRINYKAIVEHMVKESSERYIKEKMDSDGIAWRRVCATHVDMSNKNQTLDGIQWDCIVDVITPYKWQTGHYKHIWFVVVGTADDVYGIYPRRATEVD